MLKNLLRFALVVATGLATAPASLAQKPAQAAPTAAEVKKNFAIIEAGTEGESDAFDQLTAATTHKLVAYLKTHEVTAAGAEALGLDYVESKGVDHFKMFTYSYSSGGTRGTVDKPVFQWRNQAGKLLAYACHEECAFSEIHKLATPSRTLYLLLGNEKGDGRCLTSQAYVIELKGSYLLLANVFGSSPLLSLCNVDMDFNAAQQILHLDLSDTEVPEYNDDDLAKVGFHRKPSSKSLNLKFSTGRFVKSQ